MKKARKVETILRNVIILCFTVEVFCTAFDLFLTAMTATYTGDTKDVQSELDNIWLDVVQIVLALVTIYFLIVYQNFTDRVAKRDDPFSNGAMLGIVIFIVVIQKYIVESALKVVFADMPFFSQKLLVTFRQCFVAIEILFIQIPFRHNFSLEHVET